MKFNDNEQINILLLCILTMNDGTNSLLLDTWILNKPAGGSFEFVVLLK